jgi:ERCC4-type nuclease
MILVDYRAGSRELEQPLAAIFGAPLVSVEELPFGDISFTGKGPSGTTLEIGIEYKKLGEMMTSIRDGRFSGHQLPGMLGEKGMYDYGWLLIEGEWRIDDDGFLTTLQFRRGKRPEWKRAPGNMRASEYEKHLLTYQLCGGVHVRHARNQADSVRVIADLYRWWTDRAIDEHTSHLAQHRPAFLSNVSAFRRAIAAWPGVGLKWSKAAEKATVDSGNANDVVWLGSRDVVWWAVLSVVDNTGNTRRFGEANARKLVKFLRGIK